MNHDIIKIVTDGKLKHVHNVDDCILWTILFNGKKYNITCEEVE